MSWLRLLCALASCYALYAALAFVFQRELVFAGRRRGEPPPEPALPTGIERVWLTLEGEPAARVEAYHWPAAATDAPRRRPAAALLFAHGNAELIDDWAPMLAAARTLGLSVTAVEYPGYGRSEGEPSAASITRAMVAAHDWLAARHDVDAARIVAYGRSLGGGAACALARERPLAALILQSTFTSLAPFATALGLPAWLVRDRFDNRAAVAAFSGPVLVMHGDRDDVIAYAHGEALQAAARKGAMRTYRCAHNDCPPDLDVWVEDQRAFLRQHGLL